MSHRFCWLVVLDVFYFHPYLGKIPILTNIFQMGWNHQLVLLGAWEDEDETSDPQIVVHMFVVVEGILLVESKEVPEWIENARRQLHAQLRTLSDFHMKFTRFHS